MDSHSYRDWKKNRLSGCNQAIVAFLQKPFGIHITEYGKLSPQLPGKENYGKEE